MCKSADVRGTSLSMGGSAADRVCACTAQSWLSCCGCAVVPSRQRHGYRLPYHVKPVRVPYVRPVLPAAIATRPSLFQACSCKAFVRAAGAICSALDDSNTTTDHRGGHRSVVSSAALKSMPVAQSVENISRKEESAGQSLGG